MKSQTLSGPTILVVEDDPLIRNSIAQFLEHHGCAVLEAGSGEEAIEWLSDGPRIDVVFTDVRLGGQLAGWDVAEASRRANPRMRVIYTSDNVFFPRRDLADSIFIEKPYDPVDVLGICLTKR